MLKELNLDLNAHVKMVSLMMVLNNANPALQNVSLVPLFQRAPTAILRTIIEKLLVQTVIAQMVILSKLMFWLVRNAAINAQHVLRHIVTVYNALAQIEILPQHVIV